ncbi:hypothetical protein BG842_10685 [Haladaptatus sp. W1]|uniref:hypothetical protein n=1 Tax=Haladaptatus sp. W1 TaxID=1897478 RepID=UPI000849D3C4|nr:hypothetical protein [Haladaptatus sp. W1]ODR80762.1 hypothetical protein BG842_10685 [Haladaptatus sp. W1]
MVTIDGVTETGKRVVSDFSEKNVTLMAAGIAYNAFVSLAPVLLLLLIVVGIVGGGLEDRILEIAGGRFPALSPTSSSGCFGPTRPRAVLRSSASSSSCGGR